MAADILLYNSDLVPVGKDQKQHLEIARDIAQKFNDRFGPVFKLPEPVIREATAIVPGIDGRKMSKSYGNTIPLFGEEKEIKKPVMGIKTDSTPIDQPKQIEGTVLGQLMQAVESRCLQGFRAKAAHPGTGYGDLKKGSCSPKSKTASSPSRKNTATTRRIPTKSKPSCATAPSAPRALAAARPEKARAKPPDLSMSAEETVSAELDPKNLTHVKLPVFEGRSTCSFISSRRTSSTSTTSRSSGSPASTSSTCA
jgi:tryptophanyl-tRNA synthetase